jgi:hypothetical protein
MKDLGLGIFWNVGTKDVFNWRNFYPTYLLTSLCNSEGEVEEYSRHIHSH